AGIVCMTHSRRPCLNGESSAVTGGERCGASLGRELWSTDGTQAGTHRIADIGPGSASSSPQYFASWRGWLYFAATSNPVAGRELWRTSGDFGKAHQLQEINRGFHASSPAYLLAWEDRLFMAATEITHGREVWILHDPEIMSWTIIDVVPGPESSNP